MKRITPLAATATLLALAGCHSQPAQNVAAAYDNAADALENAADDAGDAGNAADAAALDNQAEATRAMGDNMADAVDNGMLRSTTANSM